jgi:tripartite-type tricarboxylate transporter receptor subunit TctC
MHRRTLLAGLLAAPVLAGRQAAAQSFPDRPIRLIVPGAPGSPTDVMARVMADALYPLLRHPLVVDLRAAAGGIVAGAAVAAAPADGHTLLYANTSVMAVNPAIHVNMTYDPATAFAPIALVSNAPMIVVVNSAHPARTFPELLAWTQANPGKLNYATSGGGSLPHLVFEMIRMETGLSATRVPYNGGGPALASVVAKETDATNEVISIVRAHVQAGTLRALAVVGRARDPLLPDVPSMAELGFPNAVISSWTGLAAPARTPPEIIGLLNARVNEALRSEPVRARFANLGVTIMGGTPEHFATWAAEERVRMTRIARAADIKPD